MALLLPPPPPPKRPTGEHTEGSASAPSSNLNPEQTGCKHIAFRVKAPFEWSSGQRTLKILEMLDPNVRLCHVKQRTRERVQLWLTSHNRGSKLQPHRNMWNWTCRTFNRTSVLLQRQHRTQRAFRPAPSALQCSEEIRAAMQSSC